MPRLRLCSPSKRFRFIARLLALWCWTAGVVAAQADSVPTMTEQQRAEFEEQLRRWESQRDGLFSELAAAVEAGNRAETYFVLKRLHGGGVGPDGSEFELRLAEIRQRRIRLAELERRYAQLTRMSNAVNLTGLDPDEYDNAVRALETRVEQQNTAIARLEDEALQWAERSIVAELPVVFELLSGGGSSTDDSGAEDPFAPPER